MGYAEAARVVRGCGCGSEYELGKMGGYSKGAKDSSSQLSNYVDVEDEN